jgi:hypothetical protein
MNQEEMNNDYRKLFEVNNSSSGAVQKEIESIEQSISVTQVQQVENAYDDCIGIIMPNHKLYGQLTISKVESMLCIGQPNVKRLMTKMSKQGARPARIYKMLLDLESSYLYMLRYMFSITRYSCGYSRKYNENVKKLINEVKNGYDDIICIGMYKLCKHCQFDYIMVVDLLDYGKMAFLTNIKNCNYNKLENLPSGIDLDPLNCYSILENAIEINYTQELTSKYNELCVRRKSDNDCLSYTWYNYSNKDEAMTLFKEQIKPTRIDAVNSSRGISLLGLFEERMAIAEPGKSLSELSVKTNSNFICVRINISRVKSANKLLCRLHQRLIKCPWYMWSESNNLETYCLAVFYKKGISSIKDYEKCEAVILSFVSEGVVDCLNCAIEDLFPNVISVESIYVPAYGPMRVNLEYNSTNSEYCCFERFNPHVLKIINREHLLCGKNRLHQQLISNDEDGDSLDSILDGLVNTSIIEEKVDIGNVEVTLTNMLSALGDILSNEKRREIDTEQQVESIPEAFFTEILTEYNNAVPNNELNEERISKSKSKCGLPTVIKKVNYSCIDGTAIILLNGNWCISLNYSSYMTEYQKNALSGSFVKTKWGETKTYRWRYTFTGNSPPGGFNLLISII